MALYTLSLRVAVVLAGFWGRRKGRLRPLLPPLRSNGGTCLFFGRCG
jgi:hypothetical protein